MTEQEKKDFLKRMGYYGGLSTPKRVEPGVVEYKKPRSQRNNMFLDKSELLKLCRMFDVPKVPSRE